MTIIDALMIEQLQDFESAMQELNLCPWPLVFSTSDWLITAEVSPQMFIPEPPIES